jgi:hypothetical protein
MIKNNLEQQLKKYSTIKEKQPEIIKKRKFQPVPLQITKSQNVQTSSPKKTRHEPEVIFIPSESVC